MGLSEQEQRMLDEIESALYKEDPKFGSAMSGHARNFESAPAARGFTIQVVALIVVGLLLLIGGVAGAMVNLWLISISILGFLLMFGAGVWALMGKTETGSAGAGERGANLGGPSGTNSNPGSPFGKKRGKGNGGFPRGSSSGGGSSNLESRFRDRFDGR